MMPMLPPLILQQLGVHFFTITRDIDNIGAVFSRSRNMLGMMPILPPLILQQLIWLQKAPN